MKLFLIFVLASIAIVQNAYTQKVKLPARYRPKEKELVLIKKIQDDLTDFVVELVRSSNIMGLSLPNCRFTTHVKGLFYKNRISSVARSLAKVKSIVFKSAIIVYIDMMPLWVQGGVTQTSFNPSGPNYQPGVYQASASGISCVILYSRITKKVVFCRCRVNKASFDWFRVGIPNLNKRGTNYTTAVADIKKESVTNNKMINCIKKIIKKGLCNYFTKKINNRKDELERIVS